MSEPEKLNVAYGYQCRTCGCTVFRVSWYTSPRHSDGRIRPPGWVTECTGCGRATLIPEKPDLTELRRSG